MTDQPRDSISLTLDEVLMREYTPMVEEMLRPSLLVPGGPPMKRTLRRRLRRVRREAAARVRMAWQILVHGEHQY